MATRTTKEDLAELVRMALRSADTQAEWGAAAHLDQALIDLTGKGIVPLSLSDMGKPDH